MMIMKYLGFGLLGAALVHCHSWVDNITIVGGVGPLTLDVGYIRAYAGHIDAISSYLIPSNETLLCKENQRVPNQNPNFPRLKAAPGSFIRASWLENGHVTGLADTSNPGYDSGPIYFYGTTNTKPDTTLGEVRNWGKSPQNGNQLLAQGRFDDGTCAEQGSQNRPLGRPRWLAGGGGACKGQFQLPETLKPGSTYTVYWIWDFSKKLGTLDPNHFEWYSSCMDIDIVNGYIPQTSGSSSQQSSKNNSHCGRYRRRT